MNIVIYPEELISLNLTINEFLYLRNLYVKEDEKIKNIFKIISDVNEDSLQSKGFIKIQDGNITLRQKGIELFSGEELFLTFLTHFPIKTPKGRYLSPAGSEGILVNKLKKKWDLTFKNNVAMKRKAIEVLDAEIKWRKENNNLEFINNAETWLNQANYEKYAYLLDEQTNTSNKWLT